MTPFGPIGEANRRASKLRSQSANASAGVALAFRDESEAEMPGSVIAALTTMIGEPAGQVDARRRGAGHWLLYFCFFNPDILSGATLRAAKVVEGSSAAGGAFAMPRRANDFPEVTPFGLGIFYHASLGHCRKRGTSFAGLDKVLADLWEGQGGPLAGAGPSLADALLLRLIPSFRSYERPVLKAFDPKDADAVRGVFAMAEMLAGTRAGYLPGVLQPSENRLTARLMETEALHGMFHAALRAHVVRAGVADPWPPLLEAFLVRQDGKAAVSGSGDIPLLVCALAAAWIRLTCRNHSPDQKVAVSGDFKALVAGCRHEQAPVLEQTLNRAIA